MGPGHVHQVTVRVTGRTGQPLWDYPVNCPTPAGLVTAAGVVAAKAPGTDARGPSSLPRQPWETEPRLIPRSLTPRRLGAAAAVLLAGGFGLAAAVGSGEDSPPSARGTVAEAGLQRARRR